MEENKLNEEVVTNEEISNEETLNEEASNEETKTEEVAINETLNNETEEAIEEKEEKAPYDGPSVTVSTRYDYKTLKYYNVVSMVYKKHYPVLYLVLALFCLAYVGFAVFNLIKSGEEIGVNKLLMPGIFVIFAIYSIYLYFNFEKSIDKNLTMHFNQFPEVSSVQTKVTLEGITVTSSKNVNEPYFYDWIYITQIMEVNEYYYFFAGRQPIIVSKDVNNILEGDADTLKEIIEEQISKKPYKKIEKNILKTPVTYVHQCDLNAETVETVEEEVVEAVAENEDKAEEANNENEENN